MELPITITNNSIMVKLCKIILSLKILCRNHQQFQINKALIRSIRVNFRYKWLNKCNNSNKYSIILILISNSKFNSRWINNKCQCKLSWDSRFRIMLIRFRWWILWEVPKVLYYHLINQMEGQYSDKCKFHNTLHKVAQLT